MKQAPNYERPGRAMPEAAEKHHYDQIRRGADRTDLISAERNIKVIAQECGKGDVPASPEIGKPDGRVRKTEIILQMKAKAERGADGARGIAGEIKKYLAGKCHHAEPGIERDERTGVTKDTIGRTGKHRVGKHDLSNKPRVISKSPQ